MEYGECERRITVLEIYFITCDGLGHCGRSLFTHQLGQEFRENFNSRAKFGA